MPPTLVNIALGVLVGVALLGAAFDRRSLTVVAAAAAAPDADAALELVAIGTTNAVFHSLFIPLAAAVLLSYDTRLRETSWLRSWYGWYGVRVAWVATAAYAVAGIAPELFSPAGAAVLYPLSDRYFAVVGRLVISTQEGLVQTYVEFGSGAFGLASPGTTDTHHVRSWVAPGDDDRRLYLVESGWQAVLVGGAVVAAVAKSRVERIDRAAGGGR
ncbi:YdjM family protein [Natronomonas pharaonis DSM 2160]|uniref:YdjM family protein n=1 Tax=Natronomonas pharaonis (strain ATCC 35678 / DSM 2160 / CIP 103997 / JCM 8858 / NBRC 14720 / NCIMB 2260 / Gabara) TaxID=348780 RepID=A0A1U7EYZ9_NATPD|nr:hypothetical protein [Natronomonas pharaonis]CAI50488.1 YdjM family protein [Natronomonas pharaonis DSM 2160]